MFPSARAEDKEEERCVYHAYLYASQIVADEPNTQTAPLRSLHSGTGPAVPDARFFAYDERREGVQEALGICQCHNRPLGGASSRIARILAIGVIDLLLGTVLGDTA